MTIIIIGFIKPEFFFNALGVITNLYVKYLTICSGRTVWKLLGADLQIIIKMREHPSSNPIKKILTGLIGDQLL